MSATQDLIDRIGGPRRAIIAFAGIGVMVLVFVVASVVSAPKWVPALSNVPLEQASAMADRLSEAGIGYKLEGGGTSILVAESDLARARVALAKGGLASGARPGLELFDRQTWGWNDFTQRVNYRRALEGELERTIGHMKGIERAEVHIAIAEQSTFRRADDRNTTASVLVALSRGETPSEDVVRGIAQLVSSSVDGLSSERVSIHDETGRMWSEPADGSVASLTGRQLRMQEDIERYLSDKAQALVADIVGTGNAHVRVSAAVGFDRVERTTHTVDPAKQALSSESKAEIVPGAQGGAGSTNIANAYDNTHSTETFSGAVGTIKRLTVAVLVNDKRQPPSSATDTIPKFTTRTPQELARIESLVRTAVGLDSTRGDAISVVSQPFEIPPVVTRAAPEPVGMGARIEQYQRPVLSVLGIAAVLVIGVLTLNALKAPAREMSSSTALALPGSAMANAAAAAAAPRPAMSIPLASGTSDQLTRAATTAEQHPDAGARMMKAWLKDA